MKKIIAFLLISVPLFAQYNVVFTDTVSNSQSKTFYYKIPANTDSISLVGIYTGEIDIDKLIVTKGVLKSNSGSVAGNFIAVATPDTTTLTVNNDSSVVTAAVYSPTSTGLNSLTGYDVVKIVFIAASSGNDATDPNELRVKLGRH